MTSSNLLSRVIGKLDPLDRHQGKNAHDLTKESTVGTQATDQWTQIWNQEKRAAVQAEMNRVKELPAKSSYAMHRIRVLNKVLQLMSIQVRKL